MVEIDEMFVSITSIRAVKATCQNLFVERTGLYYLCRSLGRCLTVQKDRSVRIVCFL